LFFARVAAAAKASLAFPAVEQPTAQTPKQDVHSTKPGSTDQLQHWEEFLGSWESDELEEPPFELPEQRCMQSLAKKFYLQVVETAPRKYAAKFFAKTTGSMIVGSQAETITMSAPPCSNSIASFHGGEDFQASSVSVSDHVLKVQITASRNSLLLQFKYVGKDRVEALPGGMDTLLNNTNLASLNGTEFQLHRRCGTC
jgi:hypothetical protein